MAKGYLYDNGDELITREDVNEVPDSSTAHAGDVLGLDSNKKPKWTTPESGLPDTTGASAGDVLSLDSDKDPVWSAPSAPSSGEKIELDQSGTPITYDSSTTLYPTTKTWKEAVDGLLLFDMGGTVCPPCLYDNERGTLTGYPCQYVVYDFGEIAQQYLVSASETSVLYFVYVTQA